MRGKLTGWRVLLTLVAFFGVVFAVNAVFIAEAVGTFRGEDQQDPYLQGIDYNQTLARREAQARLGWRATISGKRDSESSANLVVMLRRADGAPISGVHLAGILRHPTDEHRDVTLAFSEQSPGTYIARAAHVGAGAWDAVVHNTAASPFEASRRLWLP